MSSILDKFTNGTKELDLLLSTEDVNPFGKVVVNEQGEIVLVNKIMVERFEWGWMRDVIGKTVSEAFLGAREHKGFIKQFFENPIPRRMGQAKELHIEGISKTGKRIPVIVMLEKVELRGKQSIQPDKWKGEIHKFAVAFVVFKDLLGMK